MKILREREGEREKQHAAISFRHGALISLKMQISFTACVQACVPVCACMKYSITLQL